MLAVSSTNLLLAMSGVVVVIFLAVVETERLPRLLSVLVERDFLLTEPSPTPLSKLCRFNLLLILAVVGAVLVVALILFGGFFSVVVAVLSLFVTLLLFHGH